MSKEQKFDELDAEILGSHLKASGIKQDAVDMGIWTAQELHKVRSAAYEEDYPVGSALNFFPVTNELSDTDKTFEYFVFDEVGYAKIVADYTDDLPTVEALMTSETGKVFRMGNAFWISIDEIKAGMRTGKSLSTRKSRAAQIAQDSMLNTIVFNGSPKHKIPSLFDHPNITKIVSDGWLTVNDQGKVTAKDPEKASDELAAAIESIETLTRGRHMANTILIPPSMRKVLNVRMEQTTESYLQYFEKQNNGITFGAMAELEDIDGNGTKAALVFEKDPMNMSIEVPEAFNMLPPQPRDLHFRVPCTSKFTGLSIYRPLTMTLITGLQKKAG